MRLLEITTRPFLWLLSQRLGRPISKLTDIPSTVFDEWSAKGFEWVWFMGIWQLGPSGLKHDRTNPSLLSSYDSVLPGWTYDDIIGSPYSIVSYSINSVLGTESDLIWLRNQLHLRGMRLMVDFVPNHSATDAPEILSNLTFYIRAAPGTSDPSRFLPNGIAYGCGEWCDPWTDVAQFNYMDLNLRTFRIEQMKRIATLADGMRCDMSHLILNDAFWNYWQTELTAWGYEKLPTEFWADAISSVKSEFPDCVFMAESYGDVLKQLQGLGFDYTYDKDPLDRLKEGDIAGFKNLLWNTDLEYKKHLAHFTENHDEPRAVETFGGNLLAANAAAAALLTWPGLRFVNQEQWNGYARKIDVHLRRAFPEDIQSIAVEFYNHLFIVLNTNALRNGNYSLKTIDGSDTILTWKWVNDDEHILVCVNFSPNESGGNVICEDAPLTGDVIPVLDMMTDTVYERDPKQMRETGLVLVLDGYQVQIMKY